MYIIHISGRQSPWQVFQHLIFTSICKYKVWYNNRVEIFSVNNYDFVHPWFSSGVKQMAAFPEKEPDLFYLSSVFLTLYII